MTKLSPALKVMGSPWSGVISTIPEMMWQNSKVSPLMERVSPGVASHMPVCTSSPLATSCAQVLKWGAPAMSRSGIGVDSSGAKLGLGSIDFSSNLGSSQ